MWVGGEEPEYGCHLGFVTGWVSAVAAQRVVPAKYISTSSLHNIISSKCIIVVCFDDQLMIQSS